MQFWIKIIMSFIKNDSVDLNQDGSAVQIPDKNHKAVIIFIQNNHCKQFNKSFKSRSCDVSKTYKLLCSVLPYKSSF